MRFDGVDEVPLPPVWGGYRVGADAIEFCGGVSRTASTIACGCDRDGDGWGRYRLGP